MIISYLDPFWRCVHAWRTLSLLCHRFVPISSKTTTPLEPNPAHRGLVGLGGMVVCSGLSNSTRVSGYIKLSM